MFQVSANSYFTNFNKKDTTRTKNNISQPILLSAFTKILFHLHVFSLFLWHSFVSYIVNCNYFITAMYSPLIDAHLALDYATLFVLWLVQAKHLEVIPAKLGYLNIIKSKTQECPCQNPNVMSMMLPSS